jgi:hypothetical protein
MDKALGSIPSPLGGGEDYKITSDFALNQGCIGWTILNPVHDNLPAEGEHYVRGATILSSRGFLKLEDTQSFSQEACFQGWVWLVNAYNPSYLGGGDQEDLGSSPSWTKKVIKIPSQPTMCMHGGAHL